MDRMAEKMIKEDQYTGEFVEMTNVKSLALVSLTLEEREHFQPRRETDLLSTVLDEGIGAHHRLFFLLSE